MKLAASLLLSLALAPAALAQTTGRFAAYQRCHFTDGLTLVEDSPLAKGIEGRTVRTVMGPKNIPLAGGTRLLYAYGGTQPFAKVQVEQIPTDAYKQAKLDLIANFEQILTGTDPVSRNYTLKPRLNGAEIYGLDRTKLEGNVLGIYLFFVDRTHTVTTIDFLNQPADQRRFATLEDYAPLRDAFLNTFTHCATGTTSAAPKEAVTATGSVQTAKPAADTPPAALLPDAPLPNAPLPNGAAAAEASPAPTFVEPVAEPVARKPAAKPASKAPAKPASKSAAKPGSKPPTKADKKPSTSKTAKESKNTRDKKSAKPALRHKDPDQT